MISTDDELRELDHRNHDGIDVRLLWNAASDQVSIAVFDERSGESLGFEVDPADALRALHHPFAFAPNQDPRPYERQAFGGAR